MNIEIVTQKENPLFKRKEVVVEISNDVVPKREEVVKELASKFKSKEEGIKVSKIQGKFGTKKFSVIASLYESKADLDKYEIKTKKQRDAEKKSIEEALKTAKEAKKAEATANATKKAEETKPEEKSE